MDSEAIVRVLLGEAGESIHSILRTGRALSAALARVASRFGLTENEYNILRVLLRHGMEGRNDVPHRLIRDEVHISPALLSRYFAGLIERGLVTSTDAVENRTGGRPRTAALTDAGLDLITKAEDAFETMAAAVLRGIQPGDLEAQERVLSTMHKTMTAPY